MKATEVQNEQWKEYMQNYQNKRSNVQYETGLPKTVTHRDVKQKESAFNTVLAQFKDTGREQKVA